MKCTVNLNGFILCPYQVLLDLALQIPNHATPIQRLAFAPICDLQSTNDWINLESFGKPVAIRAKLICDFVYSILRQHNYDSISLHIHKNSGPLLADSLYSLLYLSQCFKQLNLLFYTDVANIPVLQQSIALLYQQENISIECTQEKNSDAVLMLQQLQHERTQAIHGLGLQIDESIFSNPIISEAQLNQLIAYAWLCLKAGGYDISCHMLIKAMEHIGKDVAMQEQIFMHLLLIRFFSNQYSAIAHTEFPMQFSSLDEAEINTLQFLKAFAATLVNDLTKAQEYFNKCCVNEDIPLYNENSLYQLNLFSLYKSAQQDTNKAFDIEFRIKNFIETNHIQTVGLRYINFMHLASLYQQQQQFEPALAYYHQAFSEISGGGYTSSDHIYYNMLLATVYEQAQQPQLALEYWIKTAMHWLACKNKYELSWRARIMLTQETVADIASPLPIDKASQWLETKIKTLVNALGLNLHSVDHIEYEFIDDTVNIRREFCFIHNNIVFYSGQLTGTLLVPKRKILEKNLAHLVASYISTLTDIPADQSVLIIDTHLDNSFIKSAEQAMAFARISNCNLCYFNGLWLKFYEFSSLKPMNAQLSPLIYSILETDKGLSIYYKRSFLNKTVLEQAEIDLVQFVQHNTSIRLDKITNSMWNNIHQLAKKRILSFSYSE